MFIGLRVKSKHSSWVHLCFSLLEIPACSPVLMCVWASRRNHQGLSLSLSCWVSALGLSASQARGSACRWDTQTGSNIWKAGSVCCRERRAFEKSLGLFPKPPADQSESVLGRHKTAISSGEVSECGGGRAVKLAGRWARSLEERHKRTNKCRQVYWRISQKLVWGWESSPSQKQDACWLF